MTGEPHPTPASHSRDRPQVTPCLLPSRQSSGALAQEPGEGTDRAAWTLSPGPGEEGGALGHPAPSLCPGTWAPAQPTSLSPGLPARGRQPGFRLATEGLSTCAHHICTGHPQLSLRKQTLTPARSLCSKQPRHPHQTQLARRFLLFVECVQFPDQLPDK